MSGDATGGPMRFGAGAIAAFSGFVASVWLANYVLEHYGVVAVGFGLDGPAAVYLVGVAFTVRDVLHRLAGPGAVIGAIIVGAGLSLAIAPEFAPASGLAFLIGELADLVVYTPLRHRSWLGAVALSNTVGLIVDSALFLWLAFGSLELFWGQAVGKAWMTVAAIVLLASVRYGRALLPRHA